MPPTSSSAHRPSPGGALVRVATGVRQLTLREEPSKPTRVPNGYEQLTLSFG